MCTNYYNSELIQRYSIRGTELRTSGGNPDEIFEKENLKKIR